MSQQSMELADHPLDAQGQKRKRFRRSRKDCDQRTFICKICEKSYLSNAALYTHVKTKHCTEKSEKVKTEKEQKSQRQEKQEKISLEQEEQVVNSSPIISAQSNKEQIFDINSTSLEGLRQYMKKYYPQRNKNCTIRLICEGLQPQILQYMEPILKQGVQLKSAQISKSKLTTNQIFGIFLILMNLRVSSTCINFLIRFFFYLKNGLKYQTKKQDFCQKQNAANLPNYFNKIVLNQRIPTPGFDEDEMMHNPRIICRVLEYFGQWLYDQRYTDYKTVPNYQKQQN